MDDERKYATRVELSYCYAESEDDEDFGFEHYAYETLPEAILDLLMEAYPTIDWSQGCCIYPLHNNGLYLENSDTQHVILH